MTHIGEDSTLDRHRFGALLSNTVIENPMNENFEQNHSLSERSSTWDAMVRLEQKAVIALFGFLIALMPFWAVSHAIKHLVQQSSVATATTVLDSLMTLGFLSALGYILSLGPKWLALRKKYREHR